MKETIGEEGLEQTVVSAFDLEKSSIITAVAKALKLSKDQIELTATDSIPHRYKLKVKLSLSERIETGSLSLTETKNTIAPILSVSGITITLATFTSQEYIFDLYKNVG